MKLRSEGKQDGITKFSRLTEWGMGRGFIFLALGFLFSSMVLHADGRAGSVEWSDGRKVSGAISLTPGKDLGIFLPAGKVAIQLASVKEISFKPEKEEMREGFYFPNAGQATQAKTGEVYPVRYLQTRITLADGKVLEGHLFTTTFYIESENATEKLVLMAKQTGANGQKLTDVVYPTAIRFDSAGVPAGSSKIDLSRENFVPIQPPVVISLPDLALVSIVAQGNKKVWSAPVQDPKRLLFSVETAEGIQVAWPEKEPDPATQTAVKEALTAMSDFYDNRTLLGSFANAEAGDVYTLVMMKRLGKTYDFSAEVIPWSLVILRWKYDAEAKKATLLNRTSLAMGRQKGNSAPPPVLKKEALLLDLSAVPPSGVHP